MSHTSTCLASTFDGTFSTIVKTTDASRPARPSSGDAVLRMSSFEGGAAVIVTVASSLLLARFESGVGDETVAVFVLVFFASAGGTPETSVIVTLWPLARSPSEHVTIVPARPHAAGVTETNVMPAGSGSETCTALAVDGPLFVTTSV